MKKVGGDFIADGSAMNLNIGFVPDKFMATAKYEETNAVEYEWTKSRGDSGNTNGQYGMTHAAGGGAYTKCADADNGIIEYDTTELKYIGQAPGGSGEGSATLTYTFATAKAASVTPTARSTSVFGEMIRPTTANGYVYECTTQGGAMTSLTEPTWGTVVGGTTSDGSNTWTCRDEKLKWVGAKGVTIGATISTDTDEWSWEAELWDSVAQERDSASYDPIGKSGND